jgi:hypothetical protein
MQSHHTKFAGSLSSALAFAIGKRATLLRSSLTKCHTRTPGFDLALRTIFIAPFFLRRIYSCTGGRMTTHSRPSLITPKNGYQTLAYLAWHRNER